MADIDMNIKDQFTVWLAQNAPASRLSQIFICYSEIESYCLRIKVLRKPLFETTDMKTVKAVQAKVQGDRMFKVTHRKVMNQMVSAIQYYVSFLKEYNQKQEAAKSMAVPEAKSSDVPAEPRKDDPIAEESFNELLEGEKYTLLRDSLIKAGISTISGLKSVNLWSFMNSHSLYSIQQRLAISTELADKLRGLDKTATEDAPTSFEIGYNDETYSGDTPSEAFLAFLSAIARKYPLKLRSLISAINPGTSKVVLRKYDYSKDKLKLQNPEVYIDSDLTIMQVKDNIEWILTRCEVSPMDFVIQEVQHITESPQSEASEEQSEVIDSNPSGNAPIIDEPAEEEPVPDSSDEEPIEETPDDTPAHTPKVFPSPAPYFTQKAEDFLLQRDLEGATYDELQYELSHTMVGTKEAVAMSPHIIEMNHRLYHEDAFVDFEEGADTIEGILDKLLKKNNGIATATQLYEYVCAEMSMFLNDNDITEQQSVYDLARHLFEKLEYHGKYYYFRSNIYISLPEVAAESNIGIMQKYAREKGDTVTFDEMGNYLKSLGLNNGNLRGVMRIDKDPIFLIYQENEYLLAELIHIDEAFLDSIKQALNHLLLDETDFVIIRNIAESWYNLLPSLPAGLDWTPMLLQEFLHFYSKKLGAKTIIAMDSQSSNTLHAAIVSNDSWVQDFRDVVAVFLHNEMPDRKSFEAEDLRKILVRAGMISGNQLIWHMHIALGGDPRFLWDGDGNKVTVRL